MVQEVTVRSEAAERLVREGKAVLNADSQPARRVAVEGGR